MRTLAASAVGRHAAVLLFYAALSVAISWPLAANLTTTLTGGGLDALSHLWGVWHAVQAFAGREPLFSSDLLYYPAGASLLLHSAGPLTGVLALPFWPLGPVAGYNGGLLIGLTLTGYAMYLLARDLDCSRPASIFAGIVLLTAPVHLVGLRGHLAKVFLGLMPLACLALRRSLDRERSAVWSAAFALTVVLLLLHSPFQFVQIALVSPLLVLAAMTTQRRTRPRRQASAVGCGSRGRCVGAASRRHCPRVGGSGDGDRQERGVGFASARPVAVRAPAVVQRALRREDNGASRAVEGRAGDRDRGIDSHRSAVAGCGGRIVRHREPLARGSRLPLAPSRSRSARPCWCSAARGRPAEPL